MVHGFIVIIFFVGFCAFCMDVRDAIINKYNIKLKKAYKKVEDLESVIKAREIENHNLQEKVEEFKIFKEKLNTIIDYKNKEIEKLEAKILEHKRNPFNR
tara:strand:- start:119 stop:418 length:300 start_codon:yes stop_codon:yes gene_type:complete